MTDRFRSRLSEYVDDELSSADRGLIEQHLATCEDCSSVLADLVAIARRAGELPPRTPVRDLWPGIARRISEESTGTIPRPRPLVSAAPRRRVSFSLPQLAAASVTLAALSGGAAWMAISGGSTGSPEGSIDVAHVPTPTTSSARVASNGAEDLASADYYAASIVALESMLFDEERPLAPATAERIRRALMIIDRAIEDARAALAETPDDPFLNDHITSTLRRKSDFLREAVRMAAQS